MSVHLHCLVVEHEERPQVEDVDDVRELPVVAHSLVLACSGDGGQVQHRGQLQLVELARLLLLQVQSQFGEVEDEGEDFLGSQGQGGEVGLDLYPVSLPVDVHGLDHIVGGGDA